MNPRDDANLKFIGPGIFVALLVAVVGALGLGALINLLFRSAILIWSAL